MATFHRISKRKYRNLLWSAFLAVGLNFLLYVVFLKENGKYSVKNLDEINDATFDIILKNLYKKPHQSKDINIQSTTYDQMLEESSFFEFLQGNDLKSRCDYYFKQLYKTDPNWKIDPNRGFSYNKDHYRNFEDFKKWRLENWKEEQKDKENKDSEPDDKFYSNEYSQQWDKIRLEEQVLHDYFSHIRIFNKCYLLQNDQDQVFNNTNFIKDQKDMLTFINYKKDHNPIGSHEVPTPSSHKPNCRDLESKIYPWLTQKYPKFEYHDGSVYSFPHLKKGFFNKNMFVEAISPASEYFNSKNGCFLTSFNKNLNGRGIVLSIADMHLELTIKLIQLLRALENTLPIQIVYYENLSDESKRQVIQAARSDYNKLPKQDIWFVDVRRSVKGEYINKFSGFGNKILATLFNSFEEMILIDADTVMLKKPDFFFNLEKFINTGTVFYKDRSTFEFRPKHDLVFFKKLFPSLKDTIVFNIPQVTSYTLENEFFKGLNHYMESGLVVINRRKHFTQPLVMAQMNFCLPIQSRVYGDKELFWLAMVISGDENYSFNKHFAAAIGELTPELERIADVKRAQAFKSQEICSNHPGHINDADNKTILWFNSGFQHCGQNKNVNFENEFSSKKRYTKAKTLEQFKSIFENKLILTHAIIPPFDMDHLTARNNEHEPERSWLNMREYCYGYTWCAYSLMGGNWVDDSGKNKDTQIKGLTIKFSEKEVNEFKRLGDAWSAYHNSKTLVNDYNKQDSSDSVNHDHGGVAIN